MISPVLHWVFQDLNFLIVPDYPWHPPCKTSKRFQWVVCHCICSIAHSTALSPLVNMKWTKTMNWLGGIYSCLADRLYPSVSANSFQMPAPLQSLHTRCLAITLVYLLPSLQNMCENKQFSVNIPPFFSPLNCSLDISTGLLKKHLRLGSLCSCVGRKKISQ